MKPSQILLLSVALALLVGIGLGFYSGRYSNPGLMGGNPSGGTTPILGLTGTVKEINGGTITLDTSSMPRIPGAPEIRKVDTTAQTVFTTQVAKSSKQLQAELNQYNKQTANLKPGEAPPTLPVPSEEKVVKLQDLKVGDTISVNADKDIRTASEFTAARITVMPAVSIRPVTVSPPPAQ